MLTRKNALLILLLAMLFYVQLSSAQSSTAPNPPGRFTIWFRNETALTIVWQPPFPAGIFTGYKASISPEDAIKSSVFVGKELTPPLVTFNGLVPGQVYNISVQTVNGDLESEAKIAQYTTVPSQPTNVTIANIKSHSFDVLWNEPNEVSEFDRYQVYVKSIGSIKTLPKEIAIGSFKYNLNQTIDYDKPLVASFDNLHPGQTYKVFVKTFSGTSASWPAHANVTTRPLPVSESQQLMSNETERPECTRYTVLSDASRSVSYGNGTDEGSVVDGKSFCDTLEEKRLKGQSTFLKSPGWVGPAWYRFTMPAGTRIPESSPGSNYCGTFASGWLSGSHPTSLGDSSDVKFCFADDRVSNDCRLSSQGKVTNCGDYFVYYLENTVGCRLRYCATN